MFALVSGPDTEVWNEGVGFYRDGDSTNALRVMRPLMASREYAARAAEIVAALTEDPEERARAAQIALRGGPDDERRRRNFSRATEGLAELRETKKLNALLAGAQGKDPAAMIRADAYATRRMMEESAGYLTNRAEKAVAEGDMLSAQAKRLADDWIVLKEAIAQSVTNEEQAATISAQVDEARKHTLKAAKELGDMDSAGYSSIALAEEDFSRFLKLVAMPPMAMGEDLVAQSNAWQDVEKVNGRDWQREALDYTRAFRAKFPYWARQYEQAAQSDTNKPPFTAEAQAKISALATELEKLQLECVEALLPPKQEEAVAICREILELLPDDGGGSQGGSSPQGASGQNQDKDKSDRKNDGQNEGEENHDEQNDETQDQDPGENSEQEREAEASEAEESEGESGEDKEIDAILRKAQERSDEHDAQKRLRQRKAPLPPNERDW